MCNIFLHTWNFLSEVYDVRMRAKSIYTLSSMTVVHQKMQHMGVATELILSPYALA